VPKPGLLRFRRKQAIFKVFPELRDGGAPRTRSSTAVRRGRRRRMSAAERKAVGQRMRAYWAKRRAEKAAAKPKRKSGMYAEARKAQGKRMRPTGPRRGLRESMALTKAPSPRLLARTAHLRVSEKGRPGASRERTNRHPGPRAAAATDAFGPQSRLTPPGSSMHLPREFSDLAGTTRTPAERHRAAHGASQGCGCKKVPGRA
jgi:hypothetical protein